MRTPSKAHPNHTQIAMSMFDGKTDVDMSQKQGLDAGDGHIIAAALESNSTVDSIIFGSQATIPLKQLRENSVEALDFEGNQLQAHGGIVLASALRENTSTQQLEASGNRMREAGAKAISEMLKVNKTLTKLDLSDNEIGAYSQHNNGLAPWVPSPKGPAALADALKSNSVLQHLKVFSNSMGSEGGKLLADAIKAHPNYTQIAMSMFNGKTDVDMSNKGLDAGDAFIIAAALEKNDQVQYLNVSQCHLGSAGGKAMAACIADNSTITSVSPLFSLLFSCFCLF